MNFRRLFFVSLLSFTTLFSQTTREPTLDEKIAALVVIGFHGTEVTDNSMIVKEIQKGLGGVILFDQDPMNKMKRKNIVKMRWQKCWRKTVLIRTLPRVWIFYSPITLLLPVKNVHTPVIQR
jgi:hypothetical protein